MFDWFGWPQITLIAVVDFLIIAVAIPWVLATKRDSTSALAWSLLVILMPVIGFLLFVTFGWNHVSRPLRRKRRHRVRFRATHPPESRDATRGLAPEAQPDATHGDLGRLAVKLGAFPLSHGNQVTLYHETERAFAEMFDAIRDARHHIHLEYYIVQPDPTGCRFLELLTQKAKEGVQVRLLYDAMGSFSLKRRLIRPLWRAAGKCEPFLPVSLLRRRIQVNMRNHRKITVVDGRVAFTGGINIGDEYLGKDPRYGYWRDEHLRLEGPAVASLQRVFVEDWHFASEELLGGKEYFPDLPEVGDAVVQIIDSGPDQEVNSMRGIYFAAILAAKERLWIATPYFVPDSSIMDALCLAGRRGVDVRLLCPLRPDHWLTYFASRYYWSEVLDAGVKLYQYSKGMMHSKLMMLDGKWGCVSGANLDNRSLHLNFEVGCLIHSPAVVEDLEAAFRKDLSSSIRLNATAFAQRPFAGRLIENACRLLAPML